MESAAQAEVRIITTPLTARVKLVPFPKPGRNFLSAAALLG
jgi:hypothetical protein